MWVTKVLPLYFSFCFFTSLGRINLVDLQQLLNVDYSHVEARVNDMVKRDGHLTLVLGQLISKTYRDHMAEEINDLLQEKGHVTIVGLTQTHDLPADFIREVRALNLKQFNLDCISLHVLSYKPDFLKKNSENRLDK